jgi:hypothetical protein
VIAQSIWWLDYHQEIGVRFTVRTTNLSCPYSVQVHKVPRRLLSNGQCSLLGGEGVKRPRREAAEDMNTSASQYLSMPLSSMEHTYNLSVAWPVFVIQRRTGCTRIPPSGIFPNFFVQSLFFPHWHLITLGLDCKNSTPFRIYSKVPLKQNPEHAL